MADNRYSTYAAQIQTEFRDSFNMAPVAPTALRAMAFNLEIQPGGNTFREYVTPFVRGTVSNLTALRARTTNTNPLTTSLTHGGQITSNVEKIGYLDHTVDTTFEWARDLEMTAGIDALYNQPSQVAARLRTQFDAAYAQWAHEECLSEAIYANEWLLASTSTISLAAAIVAGATTFKITDALKASSGLAVGDLVKIGDKRRPGSDPSSTEIIDVVIVKTLGADGSGGGALSLITIETDTAKFPASDSMDGAGQEGLGFTKIKQSLAAHANGARVQIDRPQAITPVNVDSIMSKIKTAKLRANVYGSDFICYMTPEVEEVLYGSNASGVQTPMLANEYLGKDILFNGEMSKYRGMVNMVDSNALSRTESIDGNLLATQRHYIWCFVKGQTFGFGEPLKGSGTVDKIVGTDEKLSKFSFLEVAGARTLYMGSLKGFLLPCTV